jgi:hypothetical protein
LNDHDRLRHDINNGRRGDDVNEGGLIVIIRAVVKLGPSPGASPSAITDADNAFGGRDDGSADMQ